MFSFPFCSLLVVQISSCCSVIFKFRIHFFKITWEPYIPLYKVPIGNTKVIISRKLKVHENCYTLGTIPSKEKLLQQNDLVIYLCPLIFIRVLINIFWGGGSREHGDFQNNCRKWCSPRYKQVWGLTCNLVGCSSRDLVQRVTTSPESSLCLLTLVTQSERKSFLTENCH